MDKATLGWLQSFPDWFQACEPDQLPCIHWHLLHYEGFLPGSQPAVPLVGISHPSEDVGITGPEAYMVVVPSLLLGQLLISLLLGNPNEGSSGPPGISSKLVFESGNNLFLIHHAYTLGPDRGQGNASLGWLRSELLLCR